MNSFKKALVVLSFAMGGIISVAQTNFSLDPLFLEVHWFDPTDSGGHPRTPIVCPNVSQDGHTLYFNNVGYDLELVLVDEDGEEAYTTFVAVGTTIVVLPASLSGDYELQLYPGGSYYFYSEITL